MMEQSFILFFCLLFVVAFLYASVGHGGAGGSVAGGICVAYFGAHKLIFA
ncbi:hypothetical protein [Pedobacter sp. L105]|nr:hypothetical protein [Pedobacter sp. L105]